jgi:hypothetical protein
MNAVASRSVSGSFQLPPTEASPLTRRLVLRALEAGECLSAFKKYIVKILIFLLDFDNKRAII